MKPNQIVDVVYELNCELLSEEADSKLPLMFESDGLTNAIIFLGDCIWSDDDDPRQFEDDGHETVYEPLRPFLVREINRKLDNLKKL